MTNSESLAKEILKVQTEHGTNIIDSITIVCEDFSYDIEDVIPLLGSSLTEKIRQCAIQERYVIHNSLKEKPSLEEFFA